MNTTQWTIKHHIGNKFFYLSPEQIPLDQGPGEARWWGRREEKTFYNRWAKERANWEHWQLIGEPENSILFFIFQKVVKKTNETTSKKAKET